MLRAILEHPGSLRYAGMGGAVTGIELTAVMAAAEAYGATDRGVIAQYAAACERGILEGAQERRAHDEASRT